MHAIYGIRRRQQWPWRDDGKRERDKEGYFMTPAAKSVERGRRERRERRERRDRGERERERERWRKRGTIAPGSRSWTSA